MAAARQEREAAPRSVLAVGLWQDPLTCRHDGVGGENDRRGVARGHRERFRLRQPYDVKARMLALQRSLVDVGGIDRSGHDPDPREQIETAR